jgi:hypothetical protein
MRNKLLLLAVLVMALFSACENVFEDTIADKDSAKADAEDLELALNNRNYGAIIGGLGFKLGAAPTQAQLQALSTREKYLLQMALLGESGFNAVDVLDTFLKDRDDSGSTSDILLQSFSVGQVASSDVLTAKQKLYGWTKDIEKADTGKDKHIKTAAAIAATLDTLMGVINVANTLKDILDGLPAGTAELSFDKNDSNYIGNIIKDEDVDKDKIKDAIQKVVDENSAFLDSIGENIELLEGTIKDLVPEGDTEMYDKFDEFIADFRDPATGKIAIDKEKLSQFISDQWK